MLLCIAEDCQSQQDVSRPGPTSSLVYHTHVFPCVHSLHVHTSPFVRCHTISYTPPLFLPHIHTCPGVQQIISPRLLPRAAQPQPLRTCEQLSLGVLEAPLTMAAHVKLLVVGRAGLGNSVLGREALAVFRSIVAVELLSARGYQVGAV